MKVIKLDQSHETDVRSLFSDDEEPLYVNFCQTYLRDFKQFHAFGYFNKNNKLTAFISFFKSYDDASWYWMDARYESFSEASKILDQIIKFCEEYGFMKFYCLLPKDDDETYNKILSKKTLERYSYFDEFYVGAKEKCLFNLPWQILYWRTLPQIDTVVRCSFLKNEYRRPFKASNI